MPNKKVKNAYNYLTQRLREQIFERNNVHQTIHVKIPKLDFYK